MRTCSPVRALSASASIPRPAGRKWSGTRCGTDGGALAIEQIAAADDNDRRSNHNRGVGNVAEHQVAEQHHPDDLLVEEGREYRGGCVAVGECQQVVAEAAGGANQDEDAPLVCRGGRLPGGERKG